MLQMVEEPCHCFCRPLPLIRKTRAQLKREAEGASGTPDAKRLRLSPDHEPASPAPAAAAQPHEDADVMDALDAFSALAGEAQVLARHG